MERWEYQVIHLNVESPPPAPPPPPPAAPTAVEPPAAEPPIRAEAVFSKAYLEKEFPGFYGAPPAAGAPPRDHPANQLRDFLNLQGREGWQLLGFYPVGQLQMMIFSRPLAAKGGESGPARATAGPESTAASEEARQPPDQAALLERLLGRIEALERRLPSSPPPPAEAATVPQPGALAPLQDGESLPPHRWGELEGQPRLSTPEAARALGFRSAASLLNLAARRGYPQGLIKRGVNDCLAVYVGSEKSGRGGRDRRVWVVLRTAGG